MAAVKEPQSAASEWLPKTELPNANGAAQQQSDQENASTTRAIPEIMESQLTEELLAQVFENRWSGELYFDHDHGRWFCWCEPEGRWQKNETRLAFHFVREVCRACNSNNAKNFAKATTYAGVERIAQAAPIFAVTSEVWDRDPWLLGVPKGTVDLRTGQLRAALKQDRITKQTAVAPDWRMPCPIFTKFMDEITMRNEELKIHLKRVSGYGLTGSVREQKLFFIYGVGKNGKTLYLNTQSRIMGDYAVDAAIDTFTRQRGERHPTDLARLRGARLVTATETEEGRHWDEALIKKLTGGDPVTARFMRQDFFTFFPQFKLITAGNHAPQLSNVGDAIRRRFQIIPFEFKADPGDDRLEEKLRAEWPAILAWMIDGARDWNEFGLPQPNVVSEETAQYFTGQDQLQEWLDAYCLVGPNYSDMATTVFNSWKAWAQPCGVLEKAPSHIRLLGLLRDRRLVRTRHERTGTRWFGIAVKVESQPDPRTGERDDR